jgi:hypothetical protein
MRRRDFVTYASGCCVAGHSACAATGTQGDVSHTSTELGPCMKIDAALGDRAR